MLFNFKKKKEEKKPRYSENSIYGFWEKEKITAEELMCLVASDLYYQALRYVETIESLKEDVKNHNEKNKECQEAIDLLSAGEDYPEKGLDFMLLSYHKCNKNDILRRASFRGLEIVGGMSAMEKLSVCDEIRKDEALDISKDAVIKYCQMPEVQQVAIKQLNEKNKELGFEERKLILPTDEQLSLFYDACATYFRLLEEGYYAKKPFDVNNLFTEDWRLQLPDENGVYQVMEEDIFKDYIELDYKGLV